MGWTKANRITQVFRTRRSRRPSRSSSRNRVDGELERKGREWALLRIGRHVDRPSWTKYRRHPPTHLQAQHFCTRPVLDGYSAPYTPVVCLFQALRMIPCPRLRSGRPGAGGGGGRKGLVSAGSAFQAGLANPVCRWSWPTRLARTRAGVIGPTHPDSIHDTPPHSSPVRLPGFVGGRARQRSHQTQQRRLPALNPNPALRAPRSNGIDRGGDRGARVS